MAWFFTKAALLTFGGAYAVLPYVYQGAVEHYQWLTGAADDRRPGARRDDAGPADHGGVVRRLRRRLDARPSSARTRCSWRARSRPRWSPSSPSCRRSSSSCSAAPFIESTHGKLKFTAPLTGITAAVVGVIVNLAVFFAYHVLWPAGPRRAASSGRRRSSASRRPSPCSASRSASSRSCSASGLAGLALTFLRPLFA